MFRNLSPGAIGISVPLPEALQLARANGFEGMDLIMADQSPESVRRLYAEAGVRVGGWGLPVAWNGTEEEYQASLSHLPERAQEAAEAGSRWCCTWVLSWSDELEFDQLFDRLVRRFRPIAEILKAHGHRLGLEFLGPKTLRQGHKYEFIHTIDGMLDLCNGIGTGNVGLLLDAWHWHTSGGSVQDLQKLTADDVIYVHINDAPPGIAIDEQIDNVRALPGETGVIDLSGFLRVLKEKGFDGPVTPEPFSQRVNAMPPAEAARATGEALLTVWNQTFGE